MDPWDEATISTASIATLHLGVQRTTGHDERSRRLARLGFVEAAFDPMPIDGRVARAWGALAVLDDVVDVRDHRLIVGDVSAGPAAAGPFRVLGAAHRLT